LLRAAARANEWPLDRVALRCDVTAFAEPPPPPQAGASPPPDAWLQPLLQPGACLVHGLSLEGAAWDSERQSLGELLPKQLVASLPLLALAGRWDDDAPPPESAPWIYQCPVYHHAGRSQAAWVFTAALPSNENEPRHWVLRGTAMLCL
jgi:dynein heavy chain